MKNKEELICYLEGQKAERDELLAQYDVAIEELKQAELKVEEARKKVSDFGDLEKVKEDRAKIINFIDNLNAEDKDEEVGESINVENEAIDSNGGVSFENEGV